MHNASTETIYPLAAALEVAGVKPGKFHRHFYGGALGNALAKAGEISAHISQPMRGAGVGRGGGRVVSAQGAICLGVFFRLISGGVHSVQAIRIAQTFAFLGENGDGLRAFQRNRSRPPGVVFPGKADTFLVAITNADATNVSAGFAFVPATDLTACSLTEWLGLHDADESAVCIFNLSEVCRNIRAGLQSVSCVVGQVDQVGEQEAEPALAADVLGAFLVDCTIRDDKARTPTQEFFRAFSAWADSCDSTRTALSNGTKESADALVAGLSELGIRKIKSNGNMTFSGFRWRENPIVREYLATAEIAT